MDSLTKKCPYTYVLAVGYRLTEMSQDMQCPLQLLPQLLHMSMCNCNAPKECTAAHTNYPTKL